MNTDNELQKILKQSAALLINALLLAPVPIASAAEADMALPKGSSQEFIEENNRAANNNFKIRNGILIKYNGNAEKVVIPKNVKTIGKGAFQYCHKLKSVTIPNSVKNIGKEAFSYSGLRSINIPNGVKNIGSAAFYGCSELKRVSIPKSVKSIGVCTFQSCTSLRNVSIPKSVKSIGCYTFLCF